MEKKATGITRRMDYSGLRWNYLLRGLELKNGTHKIEFTYDLPKYYTIGTIARIGSMIMLALLGFALYYSWRKRKTAN